VPERRCGTTVVTDQPIMRAGKESRHAPFPDYLGCRSLLGGHEGRTAGASLDCAPHDDAAAFGGEDTPVRVRPLTVNDPSAFRVPVAVATGKTKVSVLP
jgi:hypothetical protein